MPISKILEYLSKGVSCTSLFSFFLSFSADKNRTKPMIERRVEKTTPKINIFLSMLNK